MSLLNMNLISQQDRVSPTSNYLEFEVAKLESPTDKTLTEYACVGEAPVTFRRLTPRPIRKQVFQEDNLQTPDSLLMQGDIALASLKAEIADKQQEITYLMNKRYKDEIWNLELEKQDLLQKINDLTNNLDKSNLDLARLEQQEKRLINELEHLKALRDEELNEARAKHEQEVMYYKEMILTQRTEKEKALKELQKLNQKPRSNSVILRPVSQRNSSSDHLSSTSTASVASPPQSRTMFAVGQSQLACRRDESLEIKSLRISLDQAHDIIKTMQDRINKETEERTKADALLKEAREMADHLQNTRDKSLTPNPKNQSIQPTVGTERIQRRKSKALPTSTQAPMSVLSEELERSQHQAMVEPSSTNLSSPTEPGRQTSKGEEKTNGLLSRTELQQVCTSSISLNPNVVRDTLCQTSPHLHQTRKPTVALQLQELDSFTNDPKIRSTDRKDESTSRNSKAFSDKLKEGFLEKEDNSRNSVYSGKRKRNQPSLEIPEVDFSHQVSLDLLLKPLSKDQIQDVLAALTRCIIGEWVWKYTRKVVGVGFSEKKHRRFFWVNPYTRVLHWSTHKPGSAAQAHSKSAFVESFRIVCDNKQPSTVPYLLIKTSERNSLSALPADLSYKKKHFEDENVEIRNEPSIKQSSSTDGSKSDHQFDLNNNKAIVLPPEKSSDALCSSSTLIDFSLDTNEPLIDMSILKNY
ncbi:meiotic cell cortex C-terminal pleckstrin homology-domain-containing protein [Blakeslea trispora]|nr:meiotic cell cortex C-terminal pleckstrin homology-domain-containing protein [Blakeslea trispora]